MSEKTERPREFEPVESQAETQKFLKEGAKTTSAAVIWTKNQEQVINSHLNVYSETDKVIYAWAPKEFDPAKFMDDLAKSGVKDCFFSVSLARANIFFKAAYIGHDSGGLRFRIPDKIFKVQRRKDMRFPTPAGYVMRVEFPDPVFPENRMSKKILDVSASGLAMLVTPEEEAFFHVGLPLKEIAFTLRGRKIICDAEIKHIRAMPADSQNPGVKIGLLFQSIKPADTQFIASYVFEESRKYFSRFM